MKTQATRQSFTAGLARRDAPKQRPHLRARGFMSIELMGVLAVVAILSIAGLAWIASAVISGRVSPAATELQRAVLRMRTNAEGAGATPYAGLTTSNLCNYLRSGAIFTTTGTGAAATCVHSLAVLNAGATVTAAPGTLNGNAGDSWTVTANGTSPFACPDFAAALKNTAVVISINGTNVKAANGNYNNAAAADACNLVDSNVFVFQGV